MKLRKYEYYLQAGSLFESLLWGKVVEDGWMDEYYFNIKVDWKKNKSCVCLLASANRGHNAIWAKVTSGDQTSQQERIFLWDKATDLLSRKAWLKAKAERASCVAADGVQASSLWRMTSVCQPSVQGRRNAIKQTIVSTNSNGVSWEGAAL